MRFISVFSYFIVGWLVSSVAFADTVFLIQLGSYDSAQESDSAWKKLLDENESLFKGLSHLNSRISLPPENNKVFRLQAGPIANRADAKGICEALRVEEQECFIVETAMFVGEEEPTQMVADASALAEEATEEATAEEASLLDDAGDMLDEITQAVTAPFSTATETAVAAEVAEVATAEIEETAEEVVEAAVEQELPEIELPDEVAEIEAAVESAEEAVVEQAQTTSLLPWRRNKKQRVTGVAIPAAATPKIEIARPEKTEIKSKSEVSEADVASISAPTPKPAPAAPRTRSQLKSKVIMQQLPGVKMAVKKTPSPAPVEAAKEGSVEVAEAIPVPLSEITAATAMHDAASSKKSGLPVFKERKALGWRGTPSQNFLQKALWVKLNYFESDAAASSYWRKLRRDHPKLTKDLRMRITKPYNQRKAVKRVSMQLGPLLAYKDVQNICKVAGTPELVCEVQRDTGVSTATNSRRGAGDDSLTSRRKISERHSKRMRGLHSQFWAQMGSYRNRGDAMKVWDELKSRHSDLKPMHPHLAHPPYSSSDRTIYRLRTGPFATRAAAQELCGSLNAGSTPCIVVNN